MRRLWLFLLVLLLAGCATPEERIARALRPAIEQLPGVIRAIQEGSVSPSAGPTTHMSGEPLPLVVVVNFDIDLGQLWGIWRLFAVTTKTDVDIILVPAPGRYGRADNDPATAERDSP